MHTDKRKLNKDSNQGEGSCESHIVSPLLTLEGKVKDSCSAYLTACTMQNTHVSPLDHDVVATVISETLGGTAGLYRLYNLCTPRNEECHLIT